MQAHASGSDRAGAEAREAIRQAYLAGGLDDDAATIALLTLDAEARGIRPAGDDISASAAPHGAAFQRPIAP